MYYISRNFAGTNIWCFVLTVFGYILQVLLYNLKCGLHDWWDFNLAPLEKIAKSPNFNPSQKFLLIRYVRLKPLDFYIIMEMSLAQKSPHVYMFMVHRYTLQMYIQM